MTSRTLSGILIGAAGLLFLAAQPRSDAQCTGTSGQGQLTYYGYTPAAAFPGARTSSANFVNLGCSYFSLASINGNGPTNLQISVPCNPPSSSSSYVLAFVEIPEGVGGPIADFPGFPCNISFSPPPAQVTVPQGNSSPIYVNAYYFSSSVVRPCSPSPVCPAAYINEFGETQGTLLDDTFAAVYLPPSTTENCAVTPSSQECQLTNSVNLRGTLSGSAQLSFVTVDVDAYQTTASGGTFDRWVSSPGGTVSFDRNLPVDAKDKPYALAFYRSTCLAGYHWTSTATTSQCSACPDGKIWDSGIAQCVPLLTKCQQVCGPLGCVPPPPNGSGNGELVCRCPADQVWSSSLRHCVARSPNSAPQP
jgi:hypothetical protein